MKIKKTSLFYVKELITIKTYEQIYGVAPLDIDFLNSIPVVLSLVEDYSYAWYALSLADQAIYPTSILAASDAEIAYVLGSLGTDALNALHYFVSYTPNPIT